MSSSTGFPTVVIVGRPNVGKSTLFNAIIGQRKSITGDEPGITRDRIIGQAVHRKRPFTLIDTGGIVPEDQALIPVQILKQARFAIDEAEQIIFLIDGRTEITSADRDLAQLLRKTGKPVILAVNKIDVPKRETLTHEFYEMGFKIMSISAEHRVGIHELLDEVTEKFPAADDPEEPKEGELEAQKPIRVAIIGRPNVGKSTLLNALVGGERAIVSPVAGTTRDSVDEPLTVDGRDFVFVDTAGIRRKGKTHEMAEKLSVVMARKHIRMAHVALLLVDATEGAVGSDATIAGYAHEEGRALVICVNKWDLIDDKKRKEFEESIRDTFKFLDYAPIVFMSALEKKGIRSVLKHIARCFEAFNKRITTGQLNRFVDEFKLERDSRIFFMTQASIRPPTFVIFMNKVENLHFSTERQIVNRIRKKFEFDGTPIILKVKAHHKKREKGER